jgi:hypothetical protein
MSERRELTAEMRQKLAGFLPFSGDTSIPYTPPSLAAVPDGFRPVFNIKPLTKETYDKAIKIKVELEQGASMLMKENGIRDIVRVCVTGWNDLIDLAPETPEEIKYENTEATFKRVPYAMVCDIFFEILKMSGIIALERMSLR